MELYEKIEEIQAAIEKILKPLRLGNINFSDRVRIGKTKPPIIWILPIDSPITQSGYGESWTYNFVVWAVVSTTDPVKGWTKVNDMAAKASTALVKSHTLEGTVRHVVRNMYMPGDVRGGGAEQMCSVGYKMEAIFRHLDREE